MKPVPRAGPQPCNCQWGGQYTTAYSTMAYSAALPQPLTLAGKLAVRLALHSSGMTIKTRLHEESHQKEDTMQEGATTHVNLARWLPQARVAAGGGSIAGGGQEITSTSLEVPLQTTREVPQGSAARPVSSMPSSRYSYTSASDGRASMCSTGEPRVPTIKWACESAVDVEGGITARRRARGASGTLLTKICPASATACSAEEWQRATRNASTWYADAVLFWQDTKTVVSSSSVQLARYPGTCEAGVMQV